MNENSVSYIYIFSQFYSSLNERTCLVPVILSCLELDVTLHFPCGSDGKTSVYNAGDPGLSPGLGRSAGEGNGNPLQYYCLENPMDRGA